MTEKRHMFSRECLCESCTTERDLQDKAWSRAVENCKKHSPAQFHGRPCKMCAYGEFGHLVATLVEQHRKRQPV